MGSPLAPILANLFMAHHEESWIENFPDSKPLFYSRYVDDVFAVFNSENEAVTFFNYLNEQHHNIKFIMEKEVGKKLAFLDVFIDVSSNQIRTSVFRKEPFTGLLTSFNSSTSFSYISGLIKCLIDRAYKINNMLIYMVTYSKLKVFLENISILHILLTKILNHIYIRHMTGVQISQKITPTHIISNCLS